MRAELRANVPRGGVTVRRDAEVAKTKKSGWVTPLGRLARLPRVLRWEDLVKQRWANGKGVTYEVGRRDHLQEDSRAAGGAPWVWRVSQAELVPLPGR